LLEKNGTAVKKCTKCKIEKSFDSFHKNKNKKFGLEPACKECTTKMRHKDCVLCPINIDEKFVVNFDTSKYESLHGFCRNCRKKLHKIQLKVGGKVCRKCNINLPFGDFPHHKHTYDGFDSWCKKCRKTYRFEIKQTLDTHIRAILARAKEDRRKLEVGIDLQYLKNLWDAQDGKCAISGLIMDHTRNPRKHNLYNASLDRINSSKGYIIGNVQWLCWMVNRMKGENTTEQLIEICANIVKYQAHER
jgi:hypothetical protein